jgi:putative ABC transport system permease protein
MRRPGFTTTVLLTLALGIGANTAIFSLVRGVILKPLSFPEPDRLVHIYENHPRGTRFKWGAGINFIVVRGATLQAWRTQNTSFDSIESIRWRTRTLTGRERTDAVWSNEVSEGFFRTAGVRPAMGRTLEPDDYAAGVPRAVVISDRLWRTRYGSDRGLVGRTIDIDGASVPVVGVMPPDFFPMASSPPDLWVPYWPDPGETDDRVTWRFTTLARLKPGVTFEQAHREMDLISARLAAAYPEDYTDMDAVLVPVAGEVVGSYPRLFYTLLGAVTLLMLVGSVNVANLMLARAAERAQEFAVRHALGAAPSRLLRQVLVESLLIASIGGALGLVVARVSLPVALSLLPADNGIPRMNDVRLDWAVLGFTAAASLFVALLFGLAPALRAARSGVSESLKEGGRSTTASGRTRRSGDALVIAEIALSIVLLTAAGLVMRSLMRLQAVDPGFDTAQVLALQLTVPAHRYGPYEVGGANARRAALYRELARRVSEVPGAEAAAVTGLLPLRHGVNPWGVSIEGRGAPSVTERGGAATRLREGLFHHGSVSIERVTPGYFRTLSIRLVSGRLIDDRDAAGSVPVTVVNETFVRQFFPGEDPIGRRLTADMTSYFPKLTIVGVVADNKMHGLDREEYPLLYWPQAQYPSTNGWLVVRSRAAPEAIARAVQDAVAGVDRDVAIANVTTMAQVLGESMWRQRFTAILLVVFALLALLLATAGIYAVMSYSVLQRTHEMGLRITLGAAPYQILALIVGRGAVLGLLGIGLGLTVALAFRSIIASQLFGVAPGDPLTLIAVGATVLAVALAASAVPAMRAARSDPAAALRS